MVEGHPNQYLNEVHIYGFTGQKADAEFLTYLLKSAFMLKRIVISTCFIQVKISKATSEKARNLAHQLVENNRPGIELVLY